MRPILLVPLVACYTPPGVDAVPWEAPLLTSDTGQAAVCAPARRARVGCAVDGDTFDVDGCRDGAERVRLLGVDTPEAAHAGVPAECGADAATAELTRLLDDRVVALSFDATCTDVTSSARTLAYAWLDVDTADALLGARTVDDVLALHGDDRDTPGAQVSVNTALLVRGFARHYDARACAGCVIPRLDPVFVAAERLASARGEGLWRSCP